MYVPGLETSVVSSLFLFPRTTISPLPKLVRRASLFGGYGTKQYIHTHTLSLSRSTMYVHRLSHSAGKMFTILGRKYTQHGERKDLGSCRMRLQPPSVPHLHPSYRATRSAHGKSNDHLSQPSLDVVQRTARALVIFFSFSFFLQEPRRSQYALPCLVLPRFFLPPSLLRVHGVCACTGGNSLKQVPYD